MNSGNLIGWEIELKDHEGAALVERAVLHEARRLRRTAPPPQTLNARVAELSRRGRELILEAATEVRLLLVQPGLD